MTKTQQDVLYTAERDVSDGPVFRDVETVQLWLDDLREDWWWEEWCPMVLRVEVGRGNPGRGVAGVGWYEKDKLSGRLEFARDAVLTERRIVHELAHVIASALCNSKSHDPWFARVYYELTYLIRGATPARELAEAFDRHGIDYDATGLAPREISVR